MDIDIDDMCIIRIKLNTKELQELVAGERLFVDLDQSLQIEIYHSPQLQYDENKHYLNGEHDD